MMKQLSTIAALAVLAGFCIPPGRADDALDHALATLKEHGIASETDSLIRHLERSLPTAESAARIESLVRQLGDASFARREDAGRQLAAIGPPARAALSDARAAADAEVAWRAGELLKQIESHGAAAMRAAQQHALFVVLKDRRSPQAPRALLSALANEPDELLQDAASEALWASIDESHAELLEKSLNDAHPQVRAAAIVGWELALGEKAAERLSPLLSSDDPQVSLAACRALIDRRPADAARALVRLASHNDARLQTQALDLLHALTGLEMESTAEVSAARAWQKWAAAHLDSAKLHPVGLARLQLNQGRGLFLETFGRDAADATQGYGRMEFQTEIPAKASVAKGILRLDGKRDESDQRLCITALKMTGREEFPGSLEVRAKLGGELDNNFGWHVGVSIGRVKVLFHPSLNQGQFRAEDVASHEYFFGNEDMGFTPAADALHDLRVRASRGPRETKFEVDFAEAEPGKGVYRKTFAVPNEKAGPLDRVGLERSGRAGGAALFDELSIRLRP